MDGTADGIINTQYITVYLDDVSLTSATPPDCDAVDLKFSIDGVIAPILGSTGSGTGLLQNSSYWTSDVLNIAILSNTSISLDYNVQILNHRFLNSSSTTDILSEGVAYAVDTDSSVNLEIFTYLGFLGVYDDLTLKISHPIDWQNFTIRDPFLTNVTALCILQFDTIEIPSTLLDRLGWWKITCQAPNYAANGVIQKYSSGTSSWIDETVFHSNDMARTSVEIGFNGEVPVISNQVNFTWALPNCTTWYESLSASTGTGSALSEEVSFGPTNTTAGPWGVIYHWSNGTEIAYSCITFDLYHQAALEVVFSENLETVVGQPVTVVVRFYDLENGLLLLNDGASIIGTWAAGTIVFEANIVKNWWEADFDTALVGAGSFEVILESAAPYFETIPLVVVIKSQFLTALDVPPGPLTPLIYGRLYSYNFVYSITYNSSGIDDAIVEITEDGSEWVSVTNTGNGHYNLSIIPLGLRDYSIKIKFSKEGHANQSHVLSFLVNKVPIEVESLSSLSGLEYQPLTINVRVVEFDTRAPVSDANVTLNVLPEVGPVYVTKEMVEIGPGVYSANITMPQATSMIYNLVIQIEKANYELTQEFSSSLIPVADVNAQVLLVIMTYTWQIGIGAIFLVTAIVGQKLYSRKKQQKHATARAIKTRFDDAHNLLGVIILHKLSGVPIYSKILKGGLEEGMLSAFITAIMHFREEIDAGGKETQYTIIPISDIIRTIHTEHLICAFMTITSASKEQEARMMSYTRAIGMTLDDSLAERPTKVVNIQTTKTLEWMFDDFVDGNLLRDFQLGEKKLPRQFKKVRDVIEVIGTDGSFKLIYVIRSIIEEGVSEDDIYLMIMELIDQEYILPIYSYSENLLSPFNKIDTH
ncbi:MAG: hypothetical protein JW779_13055 [Candidatus Thorarchaeota archaeon]|nr:hypothetical protein [Candidatus Thorarchaeota archaeon]